MGGRSPSDSLKPDHLAREGKAGPGEKVEKVLFDTPAMARVFEVNGDQGDFIQVTLQEQK